MPSPRVFRSGSTPKFGERSMSFHGRAAAKEENLRRPRTVPDLTAAVRNGGVAAAPTMAAKKLTKVLLNVSVQGSVGVVQVLMSPELTVRDLISAAMKQYVKEGRRPVILCAGVDDFDLHYSPFSLESLNREEKIAELGSRNFFLCKRKVETETTSSCSKQADKATPLGSPCPPWLKFMSFLF